MTEGAVQAGGVIPDRRALFAGFLGIGLSGFGGVLPFARRMLVEQRRWLTAAEFTDLLALCQILPGPNVVNLSVAVGGRFAGASGACCAAAGLLGAPVAFVVLLGVLFARYGALPVVHGAFVGLAAAASGLVLATALKVAWPLRSRPAGIGVAALAFVAMAVLRLPLFAVLAGLVPTGVAVAAWERRRAG